MPCIGAVGGPGVAQRALVVGDSEHVLSNPADRDAHPLAQAPNPLHSSMQVHRSLLVHDDCVRPDPGKVFKGKVFSRGFAVQQASGGAAGEAATIKGDSGWGNA